jgi:type VI secretion system protein ImpA
MAEQVTINIEDLLQPISGEFPAGVKLPPIEREKLDKMRKDHNPEDYREDDPQRHEPRQSANWNGIIDQTQRLLKTTSKDLNVACRLVEALAKVHGIAGVRDGFRLLNKLCAEAWARLHPFPEIADLEEAESRLRDFRWLDDPESDMKGAKFPQTVKSLTIARLGETVITVMNCRPAGTKPPLVNSDQMKFVAGGLEKAELAATVKLFEESLEALDSLLASANKGLSADLQRLGQEESKARKLADDFVPAFTATRKALEEGNLIAGQMLQSKSSGDGAMGDMPAGVPATGGAAGGSNVSNNRETLYQQLKQIADNLERIDPHSPVPFLIRRTVELRALKFPNLVEVLTRDGRVLDFMKNAIEEEKKE